jgi:hypothetical protein
MDNNPANNEHGGTGENGICNYADKDRSLKNVPKHTLKQALDETLEILGTAVREAAYVDLEQTGIKFDSEGPSHYDIDEICKKMVEIFGEDGGLLVMERLLKVLRTYHNNR